jgi:hypothetical protein
VRTATNRLDDHQKPATRATLVPSSPYEVDVLKRSDAGGVVKEGRIDRGFNLFILNFVHTSKESQFDLFSTKSIRITGAYLRRTLKSPREVRMGCVPGILDWLASQKSSIGLHPRKTRMGIGPRNEHN